LVSEVGRIRVVLILCLVISIFSFPLVSAVEDSWTTLEPLQQARGGLGIASVNGKIYAIGGCAESGFWPNVSPSEFFGNQDIRGFVGTNEEYDPIKNNWVFRKQMPTPRGVFAIAVVENKIFCIGGKTNEGVTGANEVYDPETDSWETKTPLASAMFAVQGNVIGNKIYVLDHSGTNYVYDSITDSWTTKTPMPNRAFAYTSVVIGNKIFVIGIFEIGFFSGQASELYVYDTEADSWSQGRPASLSRSGGSGVATDGIMAPKKIYLFSYIPYLNQVYDPENNSWGILTSMSSERIHIGVSNLNDMLYAIGGYIFDSVGFFEPIGVNERYTPVGYIPEFPSWIILPLFLAATLVAIVLKKRLFQTRS